MLYTFDCASFCYDDDILIDILQPASARGTGITITNQIKEIPEKTSLIAQQFVSSEIEMPFQFLSF